METPTPPPADGARPELDAAGAELIAAGLAEVLAVMADCRGYLGGIYGLLKSQEGMAAGLGDLAPMVMQLLGGAMPAGPANGAHPVIEGDTVG